MTEEFVVDERQQSQAPTPRVVVTNDDGIESPGLHAVAIALAEDYDVVVAAPDGQMSGSGTAIGRFAADLSVDMRRAQFDGLVAYVVAGPPGLAVTAAALGAFGRPPDLVVSGINQGINTGHSVIHSGTVGGALTARTFKCHGLAVSLAESDPWEWPTAVAVARSAARWILGRAAGPTVLNVNVPGLPLDRVRGIHWADLDAFGHFSVATADEPGERLQFKLHGSTAGLDPASDTALCAEGFVTVTPLRTVEPAPFPDEDVTAVWAPSLSDVKTGST